MEPEAAAADAVHCGLCGGELDGAVLMTCLHVLCRNCAPSPTSGGRAGHEGTSYICPVCCPAEFTRQNRSVIQRDDVGEKRQSYRGAALCFRGSPQAEK